MAKFPIRYPRVITAVLAITVVTILADLIIFRQFILPRQLASENVGLPMWLFMYGPVLASYAWTGWYLRGREIQPAAAGVSLLAHCWGFVAALAEMPGHTASFSLESPLSYWTLGLFVRFLLTAMFLLIASILFAPRKKKDRNPQA